MHCMLIGRLEHNRQTIIDKIFVLHSDLSLVWPAMATNHNRKHSHLDIMVNAQWERVLVVAGQKNKHSFYFTFWRNLVLSISFSKHNHFKICKACMIYLKFASIKQPLPHFQLLNRYGSICGCAKSHCALSIDADLHLFNKQSFNRRTLVSNLTAISNCQV